MAYSSWSVVAGEQPSASKWNILGTNDAYFDSLIGSGTAWTSWTPTWDNLTVGNATQNAYYVQLGKLVLGHLSLVFGSSSSMGTNPDFSLPVTAASKYGTAVDHVIGMAWYATDSNYMGRLITSSVIGLTKGQLVFEQYNGADTAVTATGLSNTTPTATTWGTGSTIGVDFWYEAA